MRISNMASAKGNTVPNQFIIKEAVVRIKGRALKGTMFQSYSTNIAFKSEGRVYLDKDNWDYSVTTGKYRNQFLGEGITTTRKKIDSGVYALADLNVNQ